MDDQPRFDMSRFGQRESKAYGMLQLRLRRLALQLANSGSLSDDEFEMKMSELARLVEEAESSISRVLVDLPRAWLVPDAPDGLDWSDARSLNWVRVDKMDALRDALVEARAPEVVTGK